MGWVGAFFEGVFFKVFLRFCGFFYHKDPTIFIFMRCFFVLCFVPSVLGVFPKRS